MERDIITAIHNTLRPINLFSVLGGSLETLSLTDGETTRRLPAYLDDYGEYKTLVPDHSETAICFFRLGSITTTGTSAKSAAVTMPCWINSGANKTIMDDVSSYLSVFLDRAKFRGVNSLDRLVVTDISVLSKEAALSEWRNFDLSESETLYLNHPYQCFALSFTVTFTVGACLELPRSITC